MSDEMNKLLVLLFSVNFRLNCRLVIISSLSTSCVRFLIVILFCKLSKAVCNVCFSMASMLYLKNLKFSFFWWFLGYKNVNFCCKMTIYCEILKVHQIWPKKLTFSQVNSFWSPLRDPKMSFVTVLPSNFPLATPFAIVCSYRLLALTFWKLLMIEKELNTDFIIKNYFLFWDLLAIVPTLRNRNNNEGRKKSFWNFRGRWEILRIFVDF